MEEAVEGRLTGLLTATHYGGEEYGYTGAGTFCDSPLQGLIALRRLENALLEADVQRSG